MNTPTINYQKVMAAAERFGLTNKKATNQCNIELVCAAVRRLAGYGYRKEPLPNDGLPIDHFRRKHMRPGCVEEKPIGINNPPRRAD